MNVLPKERKIAVINGLCNGMSLRACSRVFETHRPPFSGYSSGSESAATSF